MRPPESCVGPAHIWEETDLLGVCDLCGDHYGVRCTVQGCYEQVDEVWYPELVAKIRKELEEAAP